MILSLNSNEKCKPLLLRTNQNPMQLQCMVTHLKPQYSFKCIQYKPLSYGVTGVR